MNKYDDGLQYYQEITPEGLVDIDPKKKVSKVISKPEKQIETYVYRGAVKRFGKIVINNFDAETTAISIKQARSNILYQAKKRMNMAPYSGGFSLVKDVVKIS